MTRARVLKAAKMLLGKSSVIDWGCPGFDEQRCMASLLRRS